MILLFHVAIALASIGFTTFLFLSPSSTKFNITYSLVGLTLLSGTYLVISQPAHILQACTTGLIYIGLVSVGIMGAHRKFSHAKN